MTLDNKHGWVVIVLLAALWGLHMYDKKQAVDSAIIVNTTTLTGQYNAKLETERQAAEKTAKQLRADIDVLKKTKDDTLKTITAKLADATRKLQERPSRPNSPNLAVATSIGEACTGAQLFRDDAVFLTGQAALADQVIAERDYYYSSYVQAQEQLQKLSDERNNRQK